MADLMVPTIPVSSLTRFPVKWAVISGKWMNSSFANGQLAIFSFNQLTRDLAAEVILLPSPGSLDMEADGSADPSTQV